MCEETFLNLLTVSAAGSHDVTFYQKIQNYLTNKKHSFEISVQNMIDNCKIFTVEGRRKKIDGKQETKSNSIKTIKVWAI